MKQELAVSCREKTENQAEQNLSQAVAGIKPHPTAPYCRFVRYDRGNLAHADLQRGVTRCEIWPPERIDEVDDSERKDNARTYHHENSCGHPKPPDIAPKLYRCRRVDGYPSG